MAKLFLALACALLPGMPQNPVPPAPPQPTITISPMPPSQGGTMSVSYNGRLPVTLSLDWDPASGPATVTIPVGGSAKVTVPAGATSVVVSDPTPGGANAQPTVINP